MGLAWRAISRAERAVRVLRRIGKQWGKTRRTSRVVTAPNRRAEAFVILRLGQCIHDRSNAGRSPATCIEIATFGHAAAGIRDRAIRFAVIGRMASSLADSNVVAEEALVERAVLALAKGFVFRPASVRWACIADLCAAAPCAIVAANTVIKACRGPGFATSTGLALAQNPIGYTGVSCQERLVALNKLCALLAGLAAGLRDRIAGFWGPPIWILAGTPKRLT